MIGKYIRLILGGIICIGAVALFMEGEIGWGILTVLIAGLVVFFHFKNEKNLMAFLFLRKNKFAAVDMILSKVKHPENMIDTQEAYYYYLKGLVETQKNNRREAEKTFKKALSTGLRMKNDQAVAKLQLSGIYLSQRNKKLSKYYLQEAKKLDKQKILSDQIKEIEYMMKRI
ncbi:hypothetical protein [Plebeiibacterium sediminum]|uniref:DUF2892 domain-containing protein n=1 Tax=Plebeiibacterium sediminum TaxID=2992112 RepID=A0AAE3M4F2_9BACT|nr:hypothetical protein [Plebeiobacterium sediminum]MCW3786460.1 hypothetical protein [Plebeiobacterium sediminum]